MFPFHRHRSSTSSSSSSTSHKVKTNGNGRNRDRAYRSEDTEYPQPTISQSHSQLQQCRWDYVLDETNNALRAKENILLSSLIGAENTEVHNDNSHRFGANKRGNIFSSLQNLNEEAAAVGDKSDTPDTQQNTVVRSKTEGDETLRCLQTKKPTELKTIPSSDIVASMGNSSRILKIAISLPDAPIKEEINSKAVLPKENFTSKENKTQPEEKSQYEQMKSEIDEKIVLSVESDKETVLSEESDKEIALSEESVKEIVLLEGPKIELVLPDDTKESTILHAEIKQEIVLPEIDDLHLKTEPIKSIDLNTAIQLKVLLLGSSNEIFNHPWLEQGFTFNTNHRLRYGFVQNKSGPCGILATIQAHVIKVLLFDTTMTCNCTDPLRPTSNEATRALIAGLTEVLWRAATDNSPCIVFPSGGTVLRSSDTYQCDGLTESLSVATFTSKTSLHEGVKGHLDQFTTPGARGCLLLLLSAVLSRGMNSVRSDMDRIKPLIGSNNQCTLELVNLLLIGRAVSHVFDNTVEVDAGTLKGVHQRSDVGFLSLLEHYNSNHQVGSYLKTPRYPIWVVCSENHFTLIFSSKRELVSDWRAEKHFVLYHHDPLARQQDEIKLTIDTTGLHLHAVEDGRGGVHPLEHCIRTKWKGAIVDWNGSSL